MAIKDNLTPLHGYAIRGLSKAKQHDNNLFIDALQAPLDQAEKDLYQAKLESFLDTAEDDWLEYWGSWLGLHRANGQGDDNYRKALKSHVLHSRNTIESLREALAKFLKTKVENIFIYEPFRDMMIWNSSSWNTYKFYPSTYYRYAVIDIQLDAAYNNVASQIINLFRPAGVMWVITSLVNVLNDNAPIIDFSAQTFGYPFITEYIDYAGFLKRDSHYITPAISKNVEIDDPFIYNDSLLNGGKKYYALSRAINGVSFLGLTVGSVTPVDDENYLSAYERIDPLSNMQANQLSHMDDMGVDYKLSSTYDSYNLINGSKNWSFAYENIDPSQLAIQDVKFENDGSVIEQHQMTKVSANDLSKVSGIGIALDLGLFNLEVNKNYVFSVDARSNNTNMTINAGSNSQDETLTSNWKRFFISFTYINGMQLKVVTKYDSSTADKWNLDLRNPKLVLDTQNSNDKVWTPSHEEANRSTLLGIVDFYNYFADDNPSGLTKKQKVLDMVDSSPIKNLVFRMKQSNFNPDMVKAYAYDFDLKIWVGLQGLTLTNKYQSYHLSFVSLKPYLNDNGLFFIKLSPQETDNTITVDYFGFSYGSNEYGVTECYMPLQSGYGAWIQTTMVPPEQLDLPLADIARVDHAILRTKRGLKTLLYQKQTDLSTLINLGTITPRMTNDSFYLDFDYKFTNTDSGDIYLELSDTTTSRKQDVRLLSSNDYTKSGHISYKIKNINNPTDLYLYADATGDAYHVAVSQLSENYGGNGQNLFTNSWKATGISADAPYKVFTDVNGRGESVVRIN